MLCEVQRSFGGADNRSLAVGEVVDVSEWPVKNVHNLIQRRYLKEVKDEAPQMGRARRERRGEETTKE